MEHAERARIEKAVGDNFEVKKLYQQHQQYEERLDALSRQAYLTPKEEQEQRELKHRKLLGVEKMLRLTADTVEDAAA
jgi:hypothetical protein